MRNKCLSQRKSFWRVLFSTIALIIYCPFVQFAIGQESAAPKQNSPEISDIQPKEISPGTALKIEGYRFGVDNSVKIIFLQNADELVTDQNGASWEEANLSQGLQEMNVTVPEEVSPGKCQVIIENNGQRSLPFTVEVLSLPKPPKLVSFRPSITIPGESVWINGIGFNISDTAKLVDANGKTHVVKPGISSSADTISFVLGDEMLKGAVALKVIENRSGLYQTSNSLTFRVKRTAVPLDLWQEDLESVSAGQWFEAIYTNNKLLEKATKIEFLLRQGFEEQTFFVKDFKNIRLQIPKSFSAGKIEIQNRVWINKEVSEWSKPIEYEVAENPAKPKIWSFLNIPLRAEAMFKQNGNVVAILPVVFGINPEAPISEKIKDGQLEIFTRFWKEGKFTNWKLDRTFDFRKSKFSHKSFEFGNFNEYFYIGNDSPEVFQTNRGENLRIEGDYFVGSADELRVALENEGQKIVLKPSVQIFLNRMLVKIPRNIRNGDWSVSIINIGKQVVTDIPVKLRIN
jgi:hypothetical protein